MSMFGKRGGEDGDDTLYLNNLRQAQEADLSFVENSGCVSQGRNEAGQPVLAFFPSIGFGYRDKSEELLRQMLLLFIKTADLVVNQPYSIVYAHASVSWANQQPVIYDYYKILPRKYKKNLQRIYVMHPQSSVKMFFEITKMFLSPKFYDKLQFIETVAEFQTIVPSTLLQLPYSFIQAEDDSRGLKPSGVVVPLLVDFDHQVGTTAIMHKCASYLRDHGGLSRTGLFRVPGNETLLSLVRTRMQPPINLEARLMRCYLKCVCIGAGELPPSTTMTGSNRSSSSTTSRADERLSVTLKKDGSGLATKATDSANVVEVPLDSISYLIVTDLDTIAQVIKMSLRDLPVPLITFQAYDQLLVITHQYEKKTITKEQWCQRAVVILQTMPIEHSSTLAYLLDFLREVASHSAENQMDNRNLAIVFAPTVLRPLVAETTDAMKVFAEVRLCQVILENLLTQPAADRVRGFTTLLQVEAPPPATADEAATPESASPTYCPPRRNHHDTTKPAEAAGAGAGAGASVDMVADIALDEKMLNRMAHLSVSNGLDRRSRTGFNLSRGSLGRPAILTIEEDGVDEENGAAVNNNHHIDAATAATAALTSRDSEVAETPHNDGSGGGGSGSGNGSGGGSSIVYSPPPSEASGAGDMPAVARRSTDGSDVSEGVIDEIAQRFDEEMEAANREHELMLAEKEAKAKSANKRKSKRRPSTQRRSVNNHG